MKTNGTRTLLIVIFLQLILVVISASLQAQPDFILRNPSLISGSNLQKGAKYRFNNIKPGVDGILTIADVTNGMTLDQLDGGSGFDEAFQPYINCPAKKKGYVEFLLEFVSNGTNNLVVMPTVPLTAIDIDGYEFPDEKLFETDEFMESPAFFVTYDLLGTSLDVNKKSNWYEVQNKTAINYPGIDTVQRDVMFSAVHANVSSVRFRVGADNKSKNSETRLRSVYFRRFAFANSFLAQSALLSLNGYEKNRKVQLNWTLAASHKLTKVVIEKATTGNNFIPVSEIVISAANANQTSFNFIDNTLLETTALYRLRLVTAGGSFQFSNILAFRTNTSAASEKLKVYPSVVNTTASISLRVDNAGTAIIKVVDLSGRTVIQQRANVQEGMNNVTLEQADRLVAGSYIIAVQHDNLVLSQKIIKQ